MHSLGLVLSILQLLVFSRYMVFCLDSSEDLRACITRKSQIETERDGLRQQLIDEQKRHRDVRDTVQRCEKSKEDLRTSLTYMKREDCGSTLGMCIIFVLIMSTMVGGGAVIMLINNFCKDRQLDRQLHRQHLEKVAHTLTGKGKENMAHDEGNRKMAITASEKKLQAEEASSKSIGIIYQREDEVWINTVLKPAIRRTDYHIVYVCKQEGEDYPHSGCDLDLNIYQYPEETDKPGAKFFLFDNNKHQGMFLRNWPAVRDKIIK